MIKYEITSEVKEQKLISSISDSNDHVSHVTAEINLHCCCTSVPALPKVVYAYDITLISHINWATVHVHM